MPLLVLPQNHMHHSRCSVLSRATKRNDEDYGGDGVRLGLPTFEELEAGAEITPTSKNYLGNRKEFDLEKETIKEFCDFALTFFEGV